MDKLDGMVGLTEQYNVEDNRKIRKGPGEAVKDAVQKLVKLAQRNYDNEIRGKIFLPTANNRLSSCLQQVPPPCQCNSLCGDPSWTAPKAVTCDTSRP